MSVQGIVILPLCANQTESQPADITQLFSGWTLKVLYESLVDPQQRHDLGEYYTPDWLAASICAEAIIDPIKQRVLDPACGSGSFLFHAIRHYLRAAQEAELPRHMLAEKCSLMIAGVDIHPVAIIIARVTYLLALGDTLKERQTDFSIPVFLGDSLQSNVRNMMAKEEVAIHVPGDVNDDSKVLVFPKTVCEDPTLFDAIMNEMLHQSEMGQDPRAC